MRTRFRGITVREAALFEGPAGWGEWSPFLEYSPDVAEPWLRCAEEATTGDWPDAVRGQVPVNVTVPAVDGERAQQIVRGSSCRTAKVKVAEPGQAEGEERGGTLVGADVQAQAPGALGGQQRAGQRRRPRARAHHGLAGAAADQLVDDEARHDLRGGRRSHRTRRRTRLRIFLRGGRIPVIAVAVHHPAQVSGAPAGPVAAPSARLAPPNPGRFLVFVAPKPRSARG